MKKWNMIQSDQHNNDYSQDGFITKKNNHVWFPFVFENLSKEYLSALGRISRKSR